MAYVARSQAANKAHVKKATGAADGEAYHNVAARRRPGVEPNPAGSVHSTKSTTSRTTPDVSHTPMPTRLKCGSMMLE
jgi:hypothetical protein